MSLEERKQFESYLFKTTVLFECFKVFVLEFVHCQGLTGAFLSVFSFCPFFFVFSDTHLYKFTGGARCITSTIESKEVTLFV